MAKKRTLSDLIRNEVEQQSLFNIDAYKETAAAAGSDWAIDSQYGATCDFPVTQEKGSCVPFIKPTHEPTHEPKSQWVQTYWVSRRGKKHKYFRFCYLKQNGVISSCVRVHIPGGNTESDRALLLKEKVESAIAFGSSPTQIITLIQSEKLHAPAVAPRQTLP